MAGAVVKAKVGDLEEDIREGFSGRLWNQMTGVVHEVVGKRGYLVRFHYGLEKEIQLNQINILVVRSEVEEEIKLRGVREVRQLEMIPEVREELGFYHWVYISLHFIKQYWVYKSQQQVVVELYTDEVEIYAVVLNDERERRCHMVFEYKHLGVDGTKAFLHAKKWYICYLEK